MNNLRKKKSPRAPSISLEEAIERVMKIYDKERLHPAPVEIIAQDLGYKNANNGAALGAIASLRYFGLLERPAEGKLAVTKDVEIYKYSPTDDVRRELLINWVKSPTIFSELLEKYAKGLPSDAVIKYELIQLGFIPAGVDAVIQIFKRSIEFAKFFDQPIPNISESNFSSDIEPIEINDDTNSGKSTSPQIVPADSGNDRIPVRLSGGRRAWLEIPSPFYLADKDRLKAQIDLLITDDDE